MALTTDYLNAEISKFRQRWRDEGVSFQLLDRMFICLGWVSTLVEGEKPEWEELCSEWTLEGAL